MDKTNSRIIADYETYKKQNKGASFADFCNDKNIFLDYNSALNFVSDYSRTDKEKIEILEEILEFKKTVKLSRQHEKGYIEDIKEFYERDFKSKSKIKYKELEEIYYAIDHTRLPEKHEDKTVNKVIELLNELNISNEIKIKMLIELFGKKKTETLTNTINRIANNYCSNISELSNITNVLFKVYKEINNSLKLYGPLLIDKLLLSPYNSDESLQKSVIYTIFEKQIDKKETYNILLIEPSYALAEILLKKYSNCNATVIFIDENRSRIFNLANNDNLRLKVYDLNSPELKKEFKLSYFDKIIVFSSRLTDNEKNIIYRGLFERTTSNSSLYILDNDYSILNNNGLTNMFIKGNSLYPTEIHLFPENIKDVFVHKRKTFIIVDLENTNNKKTLCFQYKIKEVNSKQYVYKCDESLEYDYYCAESTQETLRNSFRKTQRESERKTNETHNKAEKMQISGLLAVRYVIPNTYKVSADIYDVVNGNKIPNTHKQKNCGSYEEAMSWLMFEYPFGLSKNKTKISESVKEYFGKKLDNAALSYNDILCIYPELLENYNEEKKKLAKEILKYDFSHIELNQNTADLIVDQICEETSDEENVDVIEATTSIINDIYEYAIKKGHAYVNVLSEYLPIIKQAKSNLNQLRLALANRSLSAKNYKKAVNTTTRKIDNGYTEHLTVLLKELSPLDYKEISAITLGDIYIPKAFNDSKKIVAINVCKMIKKVNGKYKYVELDKLEKYRKVVLMDKLGTYVIEQYEKQMTKYQGISNIQNIPLIEGDTKIAKGIKIIKPEAISKLCKKLIKDLNVGEEIIRLFNDEEEITSDLNKYKGDFLASNLRYYLTSEDVCRFNRNEIEIYFGNKPPSTHARNYIDYETDAMLLETYNKLNYLYTVISDEKIHCGKEQVYHESFKVDSSEMSKNITILKLNASLEDKLFIDNEYGFDITISKMEDNNV